jgi:uncharacterized membrane protein YedE/YeeE
MGQGLMPNAQSLTSAPGSSGGTLTRQWTRADTKRTILAVTIIVALLVIAFTLNATGEGNTAPSFSLLVGASLGIAFERGRFCFYCIFREAIEERKTTASLSILAAIATGAVGYAVLFGLFLPNPAGEGLPPGAHISPVSLPLVAGSFAFGIGMTLSGACISGHLYRLGQGYLRAVPALIGSLIGFGLGFLTWNTLYLRYISESPTMWLPRWLGYGGSTIVTLAVSALLAIVVIRLNRGQTSDQFAITGNTLVDLHERLLVRQWGPLVTGSLVGIIGVFAYLRVAPLGVTSQLSTLSRTFLDSRGALPEVMHGIDLMKGCVGVVTTTITNNGWLIIGLTTASLASALSGNRFRLQNPGIKGSSSALVGGILLGWGSMTALGCTVGVLLSGTQAFAVSGIVFAVFMFTGIYVGIKFKLHLLG